MGMGEKRFLNHLEELKELIYFLVITLFAIIARISAKDYISVDANIFLLPWYDEIKAGGGIIALKNQIGDYGVPYQFLIALMTYIPVKPLYTYKTLSCFFDFGLALVGAKFAALLANNKSKGLFLKAYGALLFLPTIIMNSAIWAQCDAMYTFFVILALYHLYKGRSVTAFLCWGIALALKLQAIFVVPFIIYCWVKERKFSIWGGGISLLTNYIMYIPGFIMGRSFLTPFSIYAKQAGIYRDMYLNFPSFWVLFGNDYANLKMIAILLTIGILGTGLFILMDSNIKIEEPQQFIKLLIWSLWACVLFLPSMHERYAYLLDTVLLISIFVDRRQCKYAVAAILCSILTYSRYLWGNPTDLKKLGIAYTIAFLHYSYMLYQENCTKE